MNRIRKRMAVRQKTEVSTRRKKYDDVTAVGSYLVQERRIQDYGLRLLFCFENNEMSQKRGEVIRWILPGFWCC